MLQPGTQVPVLEGFDQDHQTLRLQDYKGKKVILFFYPKDNTPTCTKEACNLGENYGRLQEAGLEVIGVSTDPVKSHKKFAEKFDLPFPLVADTDQRWVKAFGVWGEKQMFGKKYDGTHRTTFIIDEEGTILHVITKVNSGDHARQILAILGEQQDL